MKTANRFDELRVSTTLIVSLLVTIVAFASVGPTLAADSADPLEFKATPYKNTVRFKVEGTPVDKLSVQIFDLSGRRVYQGESTSYALDWARTSQGGDRLNKGTYLYAMKAQKPDGTTVRSGIGKMYLSPESINLTTAPKLQPPTDYGPKGQEQKPKSSGTTTPQDQEYYEDIWLEGNLKLRTEGPLVSMKTRDASLWPQLYFVNSNSQLKGAFTYKTNRDSFSLRKMNDYGQEAGTISLGSTGNVGINTSSPSASFEVHGDDDNLLALYGPDTTNDPGTQAEFRVDKDGNVYADGTYYGAGGVETGGADVAEKFNPSEWVEKGHVVQIDSDHEGFFEKANKAYSTKVAGVVSTNPGVVLGNEKNSETGDWGDDRPSLALAGRVPVFVTTENGPIQVGDILVSSSKPGYAMKCNQSSKCVGAIIGKAMEPLKEGEGKIMMQVTLG